MAVARIILKDGFEFGIIFFYCHFLFIAIKAESQLDYIV